MSNDDLYMGPTVLQPAPREPSKAADLMAKWIVVPLLLLLVAIVLVFYVFFSSAVVDGESMLPTLHNGDYLLITHGANSLHQGDIVVTSVLEKTGPVELVKRVIALPGDTVEIKDDVAWVNGVAEPARGQFVSPQFSVSRGPYVVPSGYVYIMGDNRPISEDSRYLGPVPLSGLKGRAVLVFAPLNRIRLVN
ncbi:MAG: signal peptidase I [Coriobacteriia bacterium]|nr:signal peptidase I [Coriobacteriia bacterium]